MTQAKHLLETTNIKIADLYVAVGYNNLTSFRRAIQEKVRCSTQCPSRIAPYSFFGCFLAQHFFKPIDGYRLWNSNIPAAR